MEDRTAANADMLRPGTGVGPGNTSVQHLRSGTNEGNFFRRLDEQTKVLRDIRDETRKGNAKRVPAGAPAGMTEPKE